MLAPVLSTGIYPQIKYFPATKLQQQLSATLQKTHYHRFSFCHTTTPVVTCIDVEENEANQKIWKIYFTSHPEKK
jgi:hypothetical protein